MSEYGTILVDAADKIATVTLNRPEKLNAINQQMEEELFHAFMRIRERPDVSVVILKAAGRSFSAGHDLNEWPEFPPNAVKGAFFDDQRDHLERWARWRQIFWDIPQPVIAQVQGHCVTVGVEIAMHCDLVVAASDAKIAWRSLGGGGLFYHMWPWLIGVRKTKELIFTGRYVSGDEAAALGMANSAVPLDQLDEHTLNLAQQIANVPLAFLAIDKRATNKCYDLMGAREAVEYSSILHSICHLEPESQELERTLRSDDWRTGIKSRDSRYESSPKDA